MGTLPANPPAETIRASRSRQVWHGPAVLHYWHLASFDAPSVAVVWAAAFAWTAHLHLPPWILPLLGLIVWAIYIGDRLLDAHAGLRDPAVHLLQERHFFHWRHRRILLASALAAFGLATWIIFRFVPFRALKPDSLLALATLAYFSGVHARRRLPGFLDRIASALLSREFLVGLIFTAGCALPAWTQISRHAPVAFPWFPLLFFVALAWLNVYAITQWESENETRPHRVWHLASFFALACLFSALFLAGTQPRAATLCIAGAGSLLLLAGLDLHRTRFTSLALRALADLVLLTPLLVCTGLPRVA